MKLPALIVATLLAVSATGASAAPLSVELARDVVNPASPQMGDRLRFLTVIGNDGSAPIEGVIAWISLVQIGAGLVASPFADFAVRQKPVVESARILPVAFGAPLLVIGMMLWRRWSG